MDKYNAWKRTEEMEIDVIDLFCRLYRQWKQILVCAVAVTVLFFVYGNLKNGMEKAEKKSAELAALTEEEQQGVLSAVNMETEIRGLEEYLDGSVLMQLDPYHKNKVIMLYGIDKADMHSVQKITECYLNFILNGGIADALRQDGSEWKMDKRFLAELIAAYQKTYSSPYQVLVSEEQADNIWTEAVFYVEVTGKDADMAEKLAEDIQSVLERFYETAVKKAGNHRLMLLSSEQSQVTDSGLQAQQHDKKASLSASRANLKAMTDAFSDKQKEAYIDTAGLEAEKAEAENTDESNRNVFKYAIAGVAGGIFAYCVIFICWYLFLDTLKSEREIKKVYTFPYFGSVSLKKTRKKTRLLFTGESHCASQNCCEQEQIVNRIKLSCSKNGITKICAAADFTYNEKEKECLERMAAQLKEWGIQMLVFENAGKDTDLWNDLIETGNVIMICRMGTTTRRMVDESMRFYIENSIMVTGAMAFI